MNSRFVPDAAGGADPLRQTPTTAIVTASYAPDFERCRLLCETMDRHVSACRASLHPGRAPRRGAVSPIGDRSRTVVDERDLLPRWLRAVDDPASLFRRRVWLSLKTQPLRGWHVQQLRRIAIAAHVEGRRAGLLRFRRCLRQAVRLSAFWRDGKVRLFRRDGVLPANGMRSSGSGRAMPVRR